MRVAEAAETVVVRMGERRVARWRRREESWGRGRREERWPQNSRKTSSRLFFLAPTATSTSESANLTSSTRPCERRRRVSTSTSGMLGFRSVLFTSPLSSHSHRIAVPGRAELPHHPVQLGHLRLEVGPALFAGEEQAEVVVEEGGQVVQLLLAAVEGAGEERLPQRRTPQVGLHHESDTKGEGRLKG